MKKALKRMAAAALVTPVSYTHLDSFTCSTPRISTTKRLVAPASNVCTPSVGVTIRQKKSLTIGMRSSSPPSLSLIHI